VAQNFGKTVGVPLAFFKKNWVKNFLLNFLRLRVKIVLGELKMVFFVIGCLFYRIISSISGISNLGLSLGSPIREIFHHPGLFKFDRVNNRHRFEPFLVSLTRIQSSEHKDLTKNLGPKFWKNRRVPLAFLKKLSQKLFVEFFTFEGLNCFRGTKKDDFRRRLLFFFYLSRQKVEYQI